MKLQATLFTFIALVITSSPPASFGADQEWNVRMRAMAAAMTCLAPLVASDEKFNDLKNHLQINSCVSDLAVQTKALKEALTKHAASGSAASLYQEDPLLPLMAASFAEDVETAKSLVNSSSSGYAQHLLRGTLTYCTGCHTRGADTSSFKFPVFKDMTKDLALADRMKLLVATRNFDLALATFDDAIQSGEADKLAPLIVERAARLGLSIAVRVEANGSKALKLIEKVSKLKTISPTFKSELETWRTSLVDLAKASSKNSAQDSKLSQLERAQALIAEAKGSKAKTASGASGARLAEINYLRATALLHAYLETKPAAKDMAEALYLLGDSYENLEPLGFWSTTEIYFEACIRKFPHSEVARRCFDAYKNDISFGYTGSAGTNIPANVQSNLRGLENLSKPLK